MKILVFNNKTETLRLFTDFLYLNQTLIISKNSKINQAVCRQRNLNTKREPFNIDVSNPLRRTSKHQTVLVLMTSVEFLCWQN